MNYPSTFQDVLFCCEKEKGGIYILITKEDEIVNGKSVVYTKCDYCGEVTKTNYRNFLNGRKNIDKDSCTHCVGKKCAEITLKKRQAEYYPKILDMCHTKGYELATNQEDIVNNRTYITYICPIHGEQKMRISNFLNGKGCPGCQADKASVRNRFDSEYIIQAVAKCGGELINPEDYINNHTKNLKIKCPSCGNVFITSLVIFTQHGGQVCSDCYSSESVGEMKIRMYLENHKIDFIQEHWFNDCRDIKPLPFDFYLPKLNLVIEFDGRQHFEDTKFFSYGIEKTIAHDAIKNTYCKDNGIRMIRIPYTQINNIEKILDKEFT